MPIVILLLLAALVATFGFWSTLKAILNFAPVQLQVPADVTVKTVNMAMELEGLSFALTNRD